MKEKGGRGQVYLSCKISGTCLNFWGPYGFVIQSEGFSEVDTRTHASHPSACACWIYMLCSSICLTLLDLIPFLEMSIAPWLSHKRSMQSGNLLSSVFTILLIHLRLLAVLDIVTISLSQEDMHALLIFLHSQPIRTFFQNIKNPPVDDLSSAAAQSASDYAQSLNSLGVLDCFIQMPYICNWKSF